MQPGFESRSFVKNNKVRVNVLNCLRRLEEFLLWEILGSYFEKNNWYVYKERDSNLSLKKSYKTLKWKRSRNCGSEEHQFKGHGIW